MGWQDWGDRQKLRLELATLGKHVSALKEEYELVSSVSSRMVGNRIHQVSADYWRAVKLFGREDFAAARNMVDAGMVEIGFIRKLLDAETAERELGEGNYFEYADKSNKQSSFARIEQALDQIALELQSLASHCKRKSRL
jgi:hypothetical protein